MRSLLKFIINLLLIIGVVWLLMRFTPVGDWVKGILAKTTNISITGNGSSGVTSGSTTDTTSCELPWGSRIPNGSTIFAYKEQFPGGENLCKEQIRTCKKGKLDGEYVFPTCEDKNSQQVVGTGNAGINGNVAIAPTGASCTTPWGQTITHGNYIVSYESPSSCKFQRRMCVDGGLLGKFMYNYCILPQDYTAGIEDIGSSFQDMTDYSDAVHQDTNTNSWQYTSINYGGGISNEGSSSNYWSDNQRGNVTVIKSWNDNKTNPLTTQGTSYYEGTKDWKKQNYTNYDLTQKGCNTPWGSFVDNGQYVIAYKATQAKAGGSCEYERRSCTNGVLHGTFNFPSCNIGGKTYTNTAKPYPNNGYNTYNGSVKPTPSTNKSCALPWGGTIAHGDYIKAYRQASSYWSNGCEGELRYCHDGILEGSYTNRACNLITPNEPGCYNGNCGDYNKSCSLPWGGSVINGQSVIAYQSPNGPCYSQKRTCVNGYLNGSYSYASCSTVSEPHNNESCALPWGGSIAHGQSIAAFLNATSPCTKQIRTCSNGYLDGSYTYSSCTVSNNTPGGTDSYNEWQDAGWMNTAPHASDTCHGDGISAFSCQASDQITCVDYRKVENDCCVEGRAKYEKRTVTCVR